MKRQELEMKLLAAKTKQISLYFHEDDTLATYCEMKGKILYDYTGHRVNRNLDIWGYVWVNGDKIYKVSFDHQAKQLVMYKGVRVW